MSLDSSRWASAPTKAEPKTVVKGLNSSRWATPNDGVEPEKRESSSEKGSGRPPRRPRRSSGGGGKPKHEGGSDVNALAARLGMVDIKDNAAYSSKERVGRGKNASVNSELKSKPKSKSIKASAENSEHKKPANPLAVRLGMVDSGEQSEEIDSDEPSRPSTSDKGRIFDRIKPVRSSANTEEPRHAVARSKQPKSEILKRKIEEQRKIRAANLHKAQQSDLLKDFLNDDSYTNWDDEI
ncbi:LADA_0H06128g1_1 [Lachancea dasiensis]|uniref:LADA_0H06128g1_1 n=1 Tax=Lachancea dasiensis TaxID=1072105 RepID=A0A1G4K1H9_9SACH|nr:LADA_0H06128g1_1 [Lachancea dasiensis]